MQFFGLSTFIAMVVEFIANIVKKYGASTVFTVLFTTFRASLVTIFIGVFFSFLSLITYLTNLMLDLANLFNSISTSGSNDCSINIFLAVLSVIGFTDAFNKFLPVITSILITVFSTFVAIMIYRFALFIDKNIMDFIRLNK